MTLKEFEVPTEVVVYLGTVALCLVLIVVFYLYLSQLFCFKNTRRILCLALNEHGENEGDSADDSNEASCDSDVEDLKRYKRIARQTSRRDSAAATAAATEASLKKPFVKASSAHTVYRSTSTGPEVPSLGKTTNATDTTATRTTDTVSIDTSRHSIATVGTVATGDNALDCENLTFSNEAFYCEDINNVELTNQSKSESVSRQQSSTLDDVSSGRSTPYNRTDSFEVLQAEEEEENDRRNRVRPSVASTTTLDDDEDDEDTLSENQDEDQPSKRRPRRDAVSSTKYPRPGVPLTVWNDPVAGVEEEAVGARCGSLRLTFVYDGRRQRLSLVVHEAAGLPDYDDETTTSALQAANYSTQVHMVLLPGKNSRCRTKIRTGDRPSYEEKFHFKIKPESVPQMGVRLRLYGSERLMRLRLIGETIIAFASLDIHPPVLPTSSTTDSSTSSSAAAATMGLPSITQWFVLEPRYNVTQSESMVDLLTMMRLDQRHCSSSLTSEELPSQFQSAIPQLLIGLSYNEITGRFSVEIVKGYSFTSSTGTRSPDTYVKMTLMSPEGQELSSSKTSVRRGKPSPFYGETFMFSVAQFQLPDVSLMISVYNIGVMKRRHMMGWFTLGYTSSTEYELEHWNEMRDSKGEQVKQWHLLLEP